RHLLWDGKKMSKSEGTFFTIQDLLSLGYSGEEIRYALVTTHYRQQVNYTMKSFDDAKGVVARLREFHGRIAGAPETADHMIVASASMKFAGAMDDDLNTSSAAGAVHEFVREVNRNLDAGRPVPGAAAAFEGFMFVLGVPLSPAVAGPPAEVQSLVQSREEARKRRDWPESDRLRDEIQKRGWIVKDTKEGAQVRKA
ncbi:MAG TPA: DALR domain-containing protein, partial [Planctomycetota bacterium]|nr:DALR domain-containing protein [Planctomycetota bacterium]